MEINQIRICLAFVLEKYMLSGGNHFYPFKVRILALAAVQSRIMLSALVYLWAADPTHCANRMLIALCLYICM